MTETATAPSRFAEVFGDWSPRAVVFDCDGMLLDTERVWNETQDVILDRLGTELDAADAQAIVGSTLEDAAAIMARAAGADYERVLVETREEFLAALAADLHLMPGAEAVVAAAAARVPIACASNSWHDALVDKLTRAGLIEHFSALESTDTVERGKPFPDMYAQGAAALGAAPGQTLAFEDSRTGARAAVAAGLRLIAVPSAGEDLSLADLALTSLEDPALLVWIDSWPRTRRA